MTHSEIMDLLNRSLFASLGYTDTQGRQNIHRVFCVWHKGLGRHLISESGRYYRYNGKGDLSKADLLAFDSGREFENGYAKYSASHSIKKNRETGVFPLVSRLLFYQITGSYRS